MSLNVKSKLLISAGLIASVSAIWHVLCIFGGPSWFEFARAPQQIIDSAQQGTLLAPLSTIVVAGLMFSCTIFAFSAASLIRKVPLLKPALITIATICTLRGLLAVPTIINSTGLDVWQVIASSFWLYVGICFFYGGIEEYKVDKLKAMIKQISDSTDSQATASEELASISVQTKNNISDQIHAIEQVATAVIQMHATSEDVAKNTNIAAEATEAARLLVDEGTLKAEQSSTGVQGLENDLNNTSIIISELADSTADITEILAVIKAISDQTNLLALNAAIEAARAGEFGRGFSVVADEVRTLASNTQKSTAEIEEKIGKVQESAKASVESMKIGRQQAGAIVTQTVDVQQTLADIKNAVYQIIDMNSQIASATEEQSCVAAEVGKQVVEIKELSHQTGIGAEEIKIATEELAQFAVQLNDHVTRFKIE